MSPLRRDRATAAGRRGALAPHGWIGLGLIAVFWPVNWFWPGLRTHLCFFPLWLGYCLTVDALALRRTGTSLLTRGTGRYAGLFALSAPLWWVFEAINSRTQNWEYLGREAFSDLEFAVLATLSFSTVVPAVLGSAELMASCLPLRRWRAGRRLAAGRRTAGWFLAVGVVMLGLLLAWPKVFFPLVWLSLYFLSEAANLWLGNRTLFDATSRGDWRPVAALFAGVLLCAFFWEMWNWRSYPQWVYHVAPFGFLHVFEMPLLGYLGYLPFSLEVFAVTHLALGLAGRPRTSYVLVGLR